MCLPLEKQQTPLPTVRNGIIPTAPRVTWCLDWTARALGQGLIAACGSVDSSPVSRHQAHSQPYLSTWRHLYIQSDKRRHLATTSSGRAQVTKHRNLSIVNANQTFQGNCLHVLSSHAASVLQTAENMFYQLTILIYTQSIDPTSSDTCPTSKHWHKDHSGVTSAHTGSLIWVCVSTRVCADIQ